MKRNMGPADRTIRILLAIIFGYLVIKGQVGGTLAFIISIVTIAFIITAFIGWCPVYVPFNFSTRKAEPK